MAKARENPPSFLGVITILTRPQAKAIIVYCLFFMLYMYPSLQRSILILILCFRKYIYLTDILEGNLKWTGRENEANDLALETSCVGVVVSRAARRRRG